MTDSLQDKAVVVTGAGSGIGRATARAFASAGAQVLAVGRTKERLVETAGDDPRITPYAADITEEPDAVVDAAVGAYGHIDIIVNNAAIIGGGALGEHDRVQVERIFQTNLFAPVFLTQAALPHLSDGGTIVNLSTAIMHGLRAWPGASIYGASKVALEFLTRTWAVELAPRRVRVVGIAPGIIATPVLVNNGVPAEQRAAMRAAAEEFTPLGRIGQPEEIAWWILNACRDEASFATGFVLAVDGGVAVSKGP
ncbi:SDR family NAD(P)-dependent oxidoreductase [Fodinicola acaciae]|uniref:SDR family NAD(P)-dependent oxidoreductase n=1 Tax=Fodinicola acaciae TaxID=2681555 RepID=UPI00165275B5|nr:SDR family oxidoreductase [Fodinicola acaciae]